MDMNMTVAVVGAGLIGQAWALVFARAGCKVRMWDGDAQGLDRSVDLITTLAGQLQQSRLVGDAAALVSRIGVWADLTEALDGVHYVQENLPERLALKKEIFERMDKLAPGTAVLASSTSSIPASAFTEHLAGRARCLVAHPVNPPYLIPVVEVCGAPWTSSATIETAQALMRAIGQKPVHVRRELEGFILNRLQGALLREAFRLVEQGYVDADGLDATVRDGLGLRWAFMGPFETIDLNAPGGLADYCDRYGGLYQSIAMEQVSTEPWSLESIASLHAERRRLLPEQALAERRTWRDRRLMELALHKQTQETNTPQGSTS